MNFETKPEDRRRWPRLRVERGSKIFHRGTWRYLPATTVDVSSHGLAIAMPEDRGVAVGDTIDVAVGWHNQPILRDGEFLSGRVVRVEPAIAGGVTLGVELLREIEVPVAA